MTQKPIDWRAEFRQHAMDLNLEPPLAGCLKGDWVLQDRWLRRMLATLEEDYGMLHAAASDRPLEDKMTAESILRKLGFADCERPRGLLAGAIFTASFVAACSRETAQVYLRLARFRQLARQRARAP